MRNNTLLCQKSREGKRMKKELKTRRTEPARQELANKRKQKQQTSASASQHGSIAQQTIASNDGLPLLSPFCGPQQNPAASTSIQQQEEELEEVENQE
uniref:Uncharacterized protein n=1 Tax=Meloidogyne javanica TaxID=6303 RepID=A0A915M4E3_MELJA